ncbi:MAG TPA: YceH family protein [Solirubrobacteraceae bacterium]|jgi:hypothetical protein
MNLSASETRVLGCMLEKQLTTPDIYPLTLNGLRLACNQSTNRDPVVEYDDTILRDALHHLERRGFTRLASGRGRAPKYRHLLAEALPMTGDEQAVMSVLMLRGPQTPGELKQRAERMHSFAELSAVHETLERLIERGLVTCLERRPGQKEDRYAQLLEDREGPGEANGTSVATGLAAAPAPAPAIEVHSARPNVAADAPVDELEERVARLEREVAALRAEVGARGSAEPQAPSSDADIDADTDRERSHEPAARAW